MHPCFRLGGILALLAGAAVPAIAQDAGANFGQVVRGQLQAVGRATVAAPMTGRIAAFSIQVGETIAEGEALVRFDCDLVSADRRVAAARLAAAEATLKVNERLNELRNISGLELEMSRADVEIARAEVRKIDVMLGDCLLRAPFAGAVVEKIAQAHEHVEIGTPLLRLIDPDRMEVVMVVPSAWLARIGPGATFTMMLDETGQTVSAAIARVVPEVDPVSQTVRVIGTLSDPPAGVIAGMSGDVTFAGGQ